jgi:alginate O-acetyltransferase complex protein AlgI
MIKFTEVTYFLLLACIVLAYYKVPDNRKWLLLLLTSVLFNLSWSGYYIFLWFALVVVCFYVGKFLGDTSNSKKRRKAVLYVSVVVCLLPLLFIKYFLPSVTNRLVPVVNWMAPIGISYYTFLIVGYLVDVNRKFVKAEQHIGYLALYLGFFPNMLAGPLERSSKLLPQLKQPRKFDQDNIKSGLYFIVWGLFKKLVLAARFGELTNPVFDEPQNFTPVSVVLALMLFSIQLYCDFSGYCDIAMGSARLFGIKLSKNFANRYYFTPSRTESWNSWNITVTSWFRDYVFFTISRGVTNNRRLEFNRLITFLITGLWHGASFSFAIWGFLQWAYVTFEIRTKKFWQQVYMSLGFRVDSPAHNLGRLIVRMLTGTLIMGWFRAADLQSSLKLYASMFGISSGAGTFITPGFFLTMGLFALMDYFNYQMGESEDIASFLAKRKTLTRRFSLFLLIELIVVFGRVSVADFYYIQF